MHRCPISSPLSTLITALAAFCLLTEIIPLGSATAATRKANTTLNLPDRLSTSAYDVENVFPALTFSEPVLLNTFPGQTNTLIVLEHAGKIYAVTNLASPNKTLFLDLTSQVYRHHESGLLGFAFHPGFATNRHFFLFYTVKTNGAQFVYDRLSRFEVDPTDPFKALPESETIFIEQLDEHQWHQGGGMQFGPDGYLYLALGDEGSDDDFYRNSQRIHKDFFSAMLRIDVDKRPGNLPPNPHPAASSHYSVPWDNPYVGATNFRGTAVDPATVRTEFFAVGFRNPWQLDFDTQTGLLYCTDTGDYDREEINLVVKGGNYGWVWREGTKIRIHETSPLSRDRFLNPLLEYPRTEGTGIGGLLLYRGDRFPELYGSTLFSYFWNPLIGVIRFGGTVQEVEFLQRLGRLNSDGRAQEYADTFNSAIGDSRPDVQRLPIRRGVASFFLHPGTGDILMPNWIDNRVNKLVRVGTQPDAVLPSRLSDTGAFSDLVTLTPNAGIEPYDINLPFWSDHAVKTRWFSVPDVSEIIGFATNSSWSFPTGSVWIKHFELDLIKGAPESRRRVETRFLVKTVDGVYGLSYRWNDAQTDADLVSAEGTNDNFYVWDDGALRAQKWTFPSRSQCLVCHTAVAGYALGFNNPQLNRNVTRSGKECEQIEWLGQLGYFDRTIGPGVPPTLPRLVPIDDPTESLQSRLRSYLFANCVHCHQPGGSGRDSWDARFSILLAETGILNGLPLNPMGDLDNRIVAPGALGKSILYHRVSTLGDFHMPPLATSLLNDAAIALLEEWIIHDLPPLAAGLNAPPSVTLMEPIEHTPFFAPASVKLKASAADSDGSITQVDFLTSGTLLHSDTSPPFEFTWQPAPLGMHILSARAVDNAGSTRTSAPVTIQVYSSASDLMRSLSSPILLTNNFIELRMGQISGTLGIIEGSTNLSDWRALHTNLFRNGALHFESPFTPAQAEHFYRIKLELGNTP